MSIEDGQHRGCGLAVEGVQSSAPPRYILASPASAQPPSALQIGRGHTGQAPDYVQKETTAQGSPQTSRLLHAACTSGELTWRWLGVWRLGAAAGSSSRSRESLHPYGGASSTSTWPDAFPQGTEVSGLLIIQNTHLTSSCLWKGNMALGHVVPQQTVHPLFPWLPTLPLTILLLSTPLKLC